MVKELNNSLILEELHEDEEELHRDEKRIKTAFILIIIFVLVLIAGTSYLIVQSFTAKKSMQTMVKVIPQSVSITPAASPSSVLTTPSPISILNTNQTNGASVKDYYINIGYGTSQSTDWTDVFGAVTTADIGQYQNIKEVHFEAFINVPTANGSVSIRLFNETDKHPVWNSEVTRDATSDTYQFISPAIVYDIGPRIYQVQMKTQMNVLVNLVQARIHVVAR